MSEEENFTLNSRLAADCVLLGETDGILVLRLENALFFWIILVPKTPVTEVHLLPESERASLLGLVQKVSERIDSELSPDKMNLGAIGNLVPQLHYHIVARFKSDPAWPGVVWGFPETQELSQKDLEKTQEIIAPLLDSKN